jgi:predicted kinase
MFEEKILSLLIGLPGSGKSTYAKTIATINPAIHIISPDEIRFQMLDYEHTGIDYDPNIEPQVWDQVKSEVRQCLRDINISECILDATNTKKDLRKDFIDIARQFHAKTKAYVFPPNIAVAKQRNLLRERNVPEKVIESMANSFEEPSFDEFDKIIVILQNFNC